MVASIYVGGESRSIKVWVHAEWIPAPVFYWMMQVTTYLNGLFILLRDLMQASMMELQ